jgi:RimJ/RimL family protein N-acetyltransferase
MDLCAEDVSVALRPLTPADAPAVAAGLADWEVARWLTRVPYPYSLADAEWFLGNPLSSGAQAIAVDGRFAGVVQIGAGRELGYWLSPAFHGLGVMTRAATLSVDAHMAAEGGPVISGYHLGNHASANVLEKLGFVVTGHEATTTVRGEAVVIRRMLLTPQAWRDRMWIETLRLTIRPLTLRHAEPMRQFAGQPEVARMMGSVPSPWPLDHAKAWIERAPWRGRPGFRAGVFLRGGPLIGMVGMSPAPIGIGYFIDPARAGHGYVTEALTALLDFAFAKWAPDEISAGRFDDNPASGRVLEKLGFVETGRGMGKSAARLEPAPIVHYRLTKAQFESRPR